MGCGEWGRILVFLHVLSMWACGGGGGFIDKGEEEVLLTSNKNWSSTRLVVAK